MEKTPMKSIDCAYSVSLVSGNRLPSPSIKRSHSMKNFAVFRSGRMFLKISYNRLNACCVIEGWSSLQVTCNFVFSECFAAKKTTPWRSCKSKRGRMKDVHESSHNSR